MRDAERARAANLPSIDAPALQTHGVGKAKRTDPALPRGGHATQQHAFADDRPLGRSSEAYYTASQLAHYALISVPDLQALASDRAYPCHFDAFRSGLLRWRSESGG